MVEITLLKGLSLTIIKAKVGKQLDDLWDLRHSPRYWRWFNVLRRNSSGQTGEYLLLQQSTQWSTPLHGGKQFGFEGSMLHRKSGRYLPYGRIGNCVEEETIALWTSGMIIMNEMCSLLSDTHHIRKILVKHVILPRLMKDQKISSKLR